MYPLFIAGVALGAVSPAAAKEACTLKQIASLEMADRPDRVVVTAQIGGAPHNLMIDTGGVVSELYDDVVKQLNLTTRPINQNVEIYGAGGDVAQRYVRVPQFKLGIMQGDNWVMIVKQRGPGQDPGIDGILGPDLLSGFDIDFDFAAHKVNFFSQDHCEGAVVYWATSYTEAEFTRTDEHIVVPMILDGEEVKAIVDTGAPWTAIGEVTSHRLFGIDTKSANVERDPDAPPDSTFGLRHRFGSLSVGGLAVKNPLIYLLPDLAQQSFNRRHTDKMDFDPVNAPRLERTELLLGMNVLTKLHLYVAYKEHKLYITGADAH